MDTKFILILCFLLFGLDSFSQDIPQISLLHKNGARQNSTLKIVFGVDTENDSTTIYCEIYDKKIQKKIPFKKYVDIINEVKTISSTDILSRNDFYLHAATSTIVIRNMQSSVSYTITGLNENDNRKEYLNFKNVVRKILVLVDLNLFDLR